MKQSELFECASYFLKALRYTLFPSEGQSLPQKPAGVKWDTVYRVAKEHCLIAAVWTFVKNNQIPVDADVARTWNGSYEMCVYADVSQLYAYEELRRAFAERGLNALPLKGLNLKHIYPRTELREMGDLDILYDRERFPEVLAVMRVLGYSYKKEFRGSHHQIFERQPVVHVEMHRTLLPEESEFFPAFQQPFERAIAGENGLRFPLEEEYLFQLAHGYKHFSTTGCGVRTVVDFTLFRRKYADQLDFEKIAQRIAEADECARANGVSGNPLKEYEEALLSLSRAWFEEEEPQIDELGAFVLSSGVFGRPNHKWKSDLEKYGAFRYFFIRVFQPYAEMKRSYPSLERFPFLLPVFWICRLFKAIFTKPKRIAREMNFIRSQKKSRLAEKN